MKAQGISNPGNYTSLIGTIESYYGDIDLQYEKDGCLSLLAEFEYSRDDRKNKHEKKHKIPMVPNAGGDKYKTYYEGSRDRASRIKKYIEYRESEQDEELGKVVINRLANPDRLVVLPEAAPQSLSAGNSKRNVRYRGNPISNAQNLFIRTLLSNMGVESFSEKDWDDTKRYFDGKCAYCGVIDIDTVRDHAIPISKYKLGEHRLGNLVPSCRSCNSKKGEQDFIEFCGDDGIAVKRIAEYMISRNYVPITEDKEKSDNIRIILHKAHEEIRITAERYIELINDLFFRFEQ